MPSNQELNEAIDQIDSTYGLSKLVTDFFESRQYIKERILATEKLIIIQSNTIKNLEKYS